MVARTVFSRGGDNVTLLPDGSDPFSLALVAEMRRKPRRLSA